MAAKAAAAAGGGQSSNANPFADRSLASPFAGRSLADVIRASNTTADPSQTSIGTTSGLMQDASAGRLSAKSMLDSLNKNNSETSGLTQGASAGMLGGVDQASGVTGGLMQDASAGMVGGVSGVDDFRSTTEERLTALEGGGEGQQVQPSVNTLESGAVSDFIPQNQQKVIGAVVDGNKPSDRGIQRMMSKRNL